MALETHSNDKASFAPAAVLPAWPADAWQRAVGLGVRLRPFADQLATSRLSRFFTRSIRRRILVSNLIGLLLLLGGLLYISRNHGYLIEAKRESLRVQGEMIAAAIAANATIETGSIVLEPGRIPDIDGALDPFNDSGLSAFELPMGPERVAPILRRLVQPTNTRAHVRARVYGRDGALIVDSAMLFSRGQIARADLGEEAKGKPRLRNFWTRLMAWIDPTDLSVYRDIGAANSAYLPEVRAALTGTATPMLFLSEKGEQIVSMAVPIQKLKAVQGVLLLSTRPGEIDEIFWEERKVIASVAALALMAALVASFLLARTIAGPMHRLSAAAEAVSRNITARTTLPDYGNRTDEVKQMATAFSKMTHALYRRAEASESFAADVAHELKNPLTAARSTAESLAYAKTEKQRHELVEQIQQELKRLNRLITDVSNASRLDAELALQASEPVDLRGVIDGVIAVFRDITQESGLKIAVDITEVPTLPDAYVVHGHEGRLGQIITNLVDNALSFSPDGGTVTVRACRKGKEVEMTVEDEGSGLPEDKLERVFDRFYTDRPQSEAKYGKNSGLGLSISREIVRAYGGRIWAQNRAEPSRGACFVVRLPAGKPAWTSKGAGASGARL